MIVEKVLYVSAEQFFGIIEQSLKSEIKDKEIKVGVKYKKEIPTTLSGMATVEVNILEYIYPKLYKVSFENSKSTTTISYKIDEISSEKINVIFEEKSEFNRSMDSWNFKFMSKIYGKSRKKKLLQKLTMIEQSIKGE